MKKSNKNRNLSDRAVCGEEGVAVREFLTKVGDKWVGNNWPDIRKARGNFDERGPK
jgi:hypothetical protein